MPAQTTCTGATYTLTSTPASYGSLSNIDTLPKQLIAQHLAFKPQTPRRDVMAIHLGLRNDEVLTGEGEARLLKVHVELRKGAWGPEERRQLVQRVYDVLVKWKGKKAEKTDIIVQLSEVEDEGCVLRNGRWGMWEGGGEAGVDEGGEVKRVG